MEFRVLGSVEAVADGRPVTIASGQQRALLALLVINANRVLSPDRIADALWGERLPASGTKALAFHVSKLRDSLAPGRRGGSAGGLETETGGYVLRVDPESIDAVRFERLAREAHALLAGDPERARAAAGEALALWRGEPLTDVAYAEFAQAEIQRLEELRAAALEDRFEAELALGDHLAAAPELEAVLAANPLRERLRALLMLALYRAGRQGEALRAAATGRRILSEELGIDPGPEVARLEARILAQDPSLEWRPRDRARATGRPRNPYKGLHAFDEADRAEFFGREALVARLVDRVAEVARDGRLLAVVGPSGSGKSSVVRAGLVPALRARATGDGGPWRVATMVPSADPLRELTAALLAAGGQPGAPSAPDAEPAPADDAVPAGDVTAAVAAASSADRGRLLLVVDQLEELFVRPDDETRTRFVDVLLGAVDVAAGRLVVVATLRADFLHVPLAMHALGARLRDAVELVTPLDRAELERAIVRPSAAAGVEVEPALVVEIVADVEHRPGALPLLEYALTELFERSDGTRLTREGYAAIGGAVGALGRQADEAWRSLDREGRELVQQLLLAMVDVGEPGVATSRRVPRAALDSLAPAQPGRVSAVLEDLRRRGLVTFDVDRTSGAPTVQVAHEALLVHWSRLAGWIEDLRGDLAIRRRLADAAAEWAAGGHSDADLASGARLDRFEVWSRATTLRLTDGEGAFLAASAAARARRVRHARTTRAGVAGALVAAVMLVSGLGIALAGRSQAEAEQADIARARELAAASLGASGDLRLLLALESAAATQSRGYVAEEAYDALQWALQDTRAAFPEGDGPVGVRAAQDGSRGVELLAPEVLMRLAAARAGRALTLDECAAYLHSAVCPEALEPPAGGASLAIRTVAGAVPQSALAVTSLRGTRVTLLSELPADLASLLAPFTAATGIDVAATSGGDGDLLAFGATATLPDVAIVARPSAVGTGARRGLLVDLDGRAAIASADAAIGPYATRLGRVAATGGAAAGQFGVPVAVAVDGLLWYPRVAFDAAGYRPPTTVDELDGLAESIATAGRVPWCFGIDASGEDASQTAAAAWVEDLYLGAEGLAEYDGLAAGTNRFESVAMHTAADALGRTVMPEGRVFGGLDSALRTTEAIAGLPMVALDPPGCWLYRGASTDAAALGERASAVPFPRRGAAAGAVLARVYEAVLVRDRPEARRLVDFLIGGDFANGVATTLCPVGVFTLRDIGVPDTCAMAPAVHRLRLAQAAGTFRARLVDVVPGDVGPSFVFDLAGYLLRWQSNGASSGSTGFSADLVWAEMKGTSP